MPNSLTNFSSSGEEKKPGSWTDWNPDHFDPKSEALPLEPLRQSTTQCLQFFLHFLIERFLSEKYFCLCEIGTLVHLPSLSHVPPLEPEGLT